MHVKSSLFRTRRHTNHRNPALRANARAAGAARPPRRRPPPANRAELANPLIESPLSSRSTPCLMLSEFSSEFARS
ncbi:hypothetical protein ACFFX0_29375 [Citricoccus parietis]|uniref:Uncharacterized protein n=1 Tax=Citricoccus parietis TaxID=592307 RepID=A0ABV5G4L4_9MICC